jgi:hypothetical protein
MGGRGGNLLFVIYFIIDFSVPDLELGGGGGGYRLVFQCHVWKDALAHIHSYKSML